MIWLNQRKPYWSKNVQLCSGWAGTWVITLPCSRIQLAYCLPANICFLCACVLSVDKHQLKLAIISKTNPVWQMMAFRATFLCSLAGIVEIRSKVLLRQTFIWSYCQIEGSSWERVLWWEPGCFYCWVRTGAFKNKVLMKSFCCSDWLRYWYDAKVVKFCTSGKVWGYWEPPTRQTSLWMSNFKQMIVLLIKYSTEHLRCIMSKSAEAKKNKDALAK